MATALGFPLVVGAAFVCMEVALWQEGSSAAVGYSTLFTLLFLLFGVAVPLTFVGSYFGYSAEALKPPVHTNLIPRAIPHQPWFLHPLVCLPLAAVLPFLALSPVVRTLMDSVWLHEATYDIYGCLAVAMMLLLFTCAAVSVLVCYAQLAHEDYNWWWRSFVTSGACAGYVMLYAAWYHVGQGALQGGSAGAVLLYYSTMLVVSVAMFTTAGSVGLMACYGFTYLIYSTVKVD
eukprot:CAMPEP_0198432022 /NCGR_PEP_ID=MMETSP1452-20131203/21425_1 /TAXON_ID=1181717 /ORGANISM="Synchroma pusillum, Strain CCMP3072" /LENGTH=232 /DNA_ID=CAMNT_0044152493 /DNA_START=41 /DNA_END=736 /DNA_ORIENTATION=+